MHTLEALFLLSGCTLMEQLTRVKLQDVVHNPIDKSFNYYKMCFGLLLTIFESIYLSTNQDLFLGPLLTIE